MNDKDIEEIVALVSNEGLFSQKIPHFKPRSAQQEMLRDVFKAYLDESIALIEAATGTGKSIAYLLPALFWAIKTGQRTVIATNTIALQEQLIKKDIPDLLKILSIGLKVSLAKGMHNYVCLRKLEDCEVEKRLLSDMEKREIETMQEQLLEAKEGSRTEVGGGAHPLTWEKVAAESESCTHMRCPHYKKCFFFKARQEAMEAQIIVANHHLLFADLRARLENNNYKDPCILPPFERVILDEAHHVEDVAKEHFAKKISRKAFLRLFNRLSTDKGIGKLKALHQKIGEIVILRKPQDEITALLSLLELDIPVEKRHLIDFLEGVFGKIVLFLKELHVEEKLRFSKEHQEHIQWKAIAEQVTTLEFQMKRWTESVFSLVQKVDNHELLKDKCEGIIADVKGLCKRLEGAVTLLHEFVFSVETENQVKWIEMSNGNIHLVTAELDISKMVRESLFDKMKTAVLCSATLATKSAFGFVKDVLGVVSAHEKIYPSPFDYENRTLFCVPTDMLQPDHPDFLKLAAEHIMQIVDLSLGHAFVLFTSYESLKYTQDLLKERLQEKKYPLFCQGDESISNLIAKFRSTNHAVLFGTDSFWEGVDIVGDHLRCVVIVKLPFLVPSDPFFEAKSEVMKREGKSPFFDYSLPQATMKFKQGFGRLIRGENDRGCVICLDPRVATKGYGKIFLNALPNCPRIFEKGPLLQERLKEFFKQFQ